MQCTRQEVTERSESCLRNFQITCYGDHISLRFWSGSKENRFVVQFSNGKIHVTTENLSWRESFERFLQRNKKIILAGTVVVGAGIPIASIAIWAGLEGTVALAGPIIAKYGPIVAEYGLKLITHGAKMITL